MNFTTENAFLIKIIYLWSWHNFYWSHFSPSWVENNCSLMNSVIMARPCPLIAQHTIIWLSRLVTWESGASEHFPHSPSAVLADCFSYLLAWRRGFCSTHSHRSWLLYNQWHVFPGLRRPHSPLHNCFFFIFLYVLYNRCHLPFGNSAYSLLSYIAKLC